jgi:hypothetical protein
MPTMNPENMVTNQGLSAGEASYVIGSLSWISANAQLTSTNWQLSAELSDEWTGQLAAMPLCAQALL